MQLNSVVADRVMGAGRHHPVQFLAPVLLDLLDAGLPKILVRCLFLLIFGHGAVTDDVTMLVCTEFFAGVGMICRAFQRCLSWS